MHAAFLDLNGTLVLPVRVHHPQEYTLIPGAIDAIRLLNANGYICPVVTVQSRIAKDIYSAEEFLDWFHVFQTDLSGFGATVVGPYLCPHRGSDGCDCKKPKLALYQRAATELDIDLGHSVVIGDTLDDLRAAHALGCNRCLVRTGWGEQAFTEHNAGALASYVASDILDAAKWIVRSDGSQPRL